MMDDWPTIDTAPRDRDFLAYEGGDYYRCRFFHQDDDGNIAWESLCGQPVVQNPEPTHWMPLPEAPKGGEDDRILELETENKRLIEGLMKIKRIARAHAHQALYYNIANQSLMESRCYDNSERAKHD